MSTIFDFIYQGNIIALKGLLNKNHLIVHILDEITAGSPLHAACKGISENFIIIMQILLEYGAIIDVKDSIGHTPLHYACGCGNIDAIKLLIDHHARLNYQDEGGNTPLHLAAYAGHYDVVKLLLSKNARFDLKDRRDQVPLMKAVEEGHDTIVKLLLENKASLNVKDKSGFYPLHVACKEGRLQCVKTLIEAKANIDQPLDTTGETALHIASSKCQFEIIKTLLIAGAKSNIKSKSGSTCLEILQDRNQNEFILKEILPLISSKADGFDLFLDCIVDLNISYCEMMISSGVSLEIPKEEHILEVMIDQLLVESNSPNEVEEMLLQLLNLQENLERKGSLLKVLYFNTTTKIEYITDLLKIDIPLINQDDYDISLWKRFTNPTFRSNEFSNEVKFQVITEILSEISGTSKALMLRHKYLHDKCLIKIKKVFLAKPLLLEKYEIHLEKVIFQSEETLVLQGMIELKLITLKFIKHKKSSYEQLHLMNPFKTMEMINTKQYETLKNNFFMKHYPNLCVYNSCIITSFYPTWHRLHYQLINNIPSIEFSRVVLRDIAKSLQQLHDCDIVHGNLSIQDIMFEMESNSFVINGLSSSSTKRGELISMRCQDHCKTSYWPPELFQTFTSIDEVNQFIDIINELEDTQLKCSLTPKRSSNSQFVVPKVRFTSHLSFEVFEVSEKLDSWSFGMLALQICFSKNIFQVDVKDSLIRGEDMWLIANWKDEEDVELLWDLLKPLSWTCDDLTLNLLDLVKKLLRREPSQRLTIKQVIDHPFFHCSFPTNSSSKIPYFEEIEEVKEIEEIEEAEEVKEVEVIEEVEVEEEAELREESFDERESEVKETEDMKLEEVCQGLEELEIEEDEVKETLNEVEALEEDPSAKEEDALLTEEQPTESKQVSYSQEESKQLPNEAMTWAKPSNNSLQVTQDHSTKADLRRKSLLQLAERRKSLLSITERRNLNAVHQLPSKPLSTSLPALDEKLIERDTEIAPLTSVDQHFDSQIQPKEGSSVELRNSKERNIRPEPETSNQKEEPTIQRQQVASIKVVLEGYCTKQSPKLSALWQRRYLVLYSHGILKYYLDDQVFKSNGESRGSLSLRDLISQNDNIIVNSNKLSLKVQKAGASMREYQIKFKNNSEARQWESRILSVCNNLEESS